MSDQEFPPRGGGEGSDLPPPPASSAPLADAWQAGPAQEAGPSGRRRPALVIGAVAVVVALVGGFVTVQLTRSGDEAEAQALALAFTQGQTQTYVIHMTMDGTMATEGFGQEPVGEMPLDMEMTETMTWGVISVDDEGVATVEVSITDVSGTMNGMTIPASETEAPPTEMKIAPDGRLLEVGGTAVPSSLQGTSGLGGVPGLDQYTPLLPDHPVKPGDSWTKDFSQEMPFGEGKIEFTTVSKLERYETVDGVEAAVITTEFELPLDFTVDFSELLAGQDTSGMDMSGVSATYGGKVTTSMTAWVDPSGKQLLKSSATGDIDMTMEMSGEIPGELDFSGRMTLVGTFAQELERK
ncbi:MAG: hypothetical protein AB1551_05955 [Actinomycetota bacterium]